jgi:hypothetical protein
MALASRGLNAEILVTPAGFVDHKPGGDLLGTIGWQTTQDDFNRLAAVAAVVARKLVTPEVRTLAQGLVGHVIVGIDVWPTPHREPHAETATGAVVPVTGKTYPNTAQQDDLIRNLDVASHVVRIGDERVAVRVCHDLAAWSPRGNAVAKGGRAEAWEGMQAAAPGGLRTRTNNKRDWGEWRVCRRFLGHTEPRRRRPARGHLVGARGVKPSLRMIVRVFAQRTVPRRAAAGCPITGPASGASSGCHTHAAAYAPGSDCQSIFPS